MKTRILFVLMMFVALAGYSQSQAFMPGPKDKDKKEKEDKGKDKDKDKGKGKKDKGKKGKKPKHDDLFKGKCKLDEVEKNANYIKYSFKSKKGFTELMIFRDKTFALRRQNDEEGTDDYLTVGHWKKQGAKKYILNSDVEMFNQFIDNMPEGAESFIYFEVDSFKWEIKNKGMSVCI